MVLFGLVWISGVHYALPQSEKRGKIAGVGPTLCVQKGERKGASFLETEVFI